MAYKILSSNPRRNTHKFFVDTTEDLLKLPKETASTALVATTGKTYICNNAKEWVEFKDNNENNSNYNNEIKLYISVYSEGEIIARSLGHYEYYNKNIDINNTWIASNGNEIIVDNLTNDTVLCSTYTVKPGDIFNYDDVDVSDIIMYIDCYDDNNNIIWDEIDYVWNSSYKKIAIPNFDFEVNNHLILVFVINDDK